MLATAMVASPAPVSSQTSIPVTEGTQLTLPFRNDWLNDLRHYAAAGDDIALRTTADDFLTALSANSVVHAAGCCDLRKNYYLLLFTTVDANGKKTLTHVLVHKPMVENWTLPGLSKHPFYEVFLGEENSPPIEGAYYVEPVADAISAQLGDFVSKIIAGGVLPGSIGNISGAPPIRSQETAPPYRYSVRLGSIPFPAARAKLTGRHWLVASQPESRLTKQLPDLSKRLQSSLSQQPPGCRKVLNDALKLVEDDLNAAECTRTLSEDRTACFQKVNDDLTASWQAMDETVSACTVDAVAPGFQMIQDAINLQTSRIDGSVTLTNAPLQRYSFGLSSGYIAHIREDPSRPRVMIQSGKIALNPFARALTMAIVNLPVWGYDATQPRVTWRERIRPFVGSAFTPYFGVTTGGSFAFTRTLAINTGYAWLWYDTPKETPLERVGQEPLDKVNPFRLAETHAIFIAAGYTFK